jgi:hypothetical protein
VGPTPTATLLDELPHAVTAATRTTASPETARICAPIGFIVDNIVARCG